MDGHREYDEVPVAEVTESVEDWCERNEPLSRAELNTVERTFMQTVGEPARSKRQVDGGEVTEKNPHMRIAPPDAFGMFAHEADVVLVELDETIECGEMIGYPAGGGGWAPVLFCVEGPVSRARDRMEFTLVTLQGLADGEIII